MTQLNHAVEPFGEVNVDVQNDGTIAVKATILMQPNIEGAKAGLAIDGSNSMSQFYGVSGIVSPIFQSLATQQNVIEPIVRAMTAFLAEFAANRQVELMYWACGADNQQVESLGSFSAAQAATLRVSGPKTPGRNTLILPVVRHLVDILTDAPWSIGVIVTDGLLSDINEAVEYTKTLAREIADGRRNFIKLVALGFCHDVDENRMVANLEQLDDCLDGSGVVDSDGEEIDIWDHKICKSMEKLEEVFAECVTERMTVLPEASIEDSSGNEVIVYPNRRHKDGMPALLRFVLPRGATSFTLKCPGQSFTQDIREAL
ncbi:MAG: hypothetical protein R3C49_04015 [Planctomycetaceae bacterium]